MKRKVIVWVAVAGLFFIKATCGDDLLVSGEFTNNGLNVVVSAPDGFTNRVEIYACSNLLSGDWRVTTENLRPVGGSPVEWYTEAGNSGFFIAGNMDVDSDGDGVPDAREMFVHKTSPESADTDGDGMPDGWELQYGFNPLLYADGGFDLDGDRLNNANEYLRGARPDIPDTDGDGLSDYAEVFIYKTDPLTTNALDTSTGYTIEQTAYEWIDISQTGQAITNFSGMDDGVAQISLGIQFPLFDATYDTAYVCNNGFVSFGESSSEWENESLPSAWIPEKTLCVFWDDLCMDDNPESAVYVQTTSNQCIISFEGIPFLEDEAARLNFQIILNADGSVLYQYEDISNDGTFPTVGMQWDEGSVEFYAGNVTNGTALLISNGQDADNDLDGVSDAWERKWFGNLNAVTNGSDFVTGDHLFTYAESAYLGLNPNVTDTDGDGLADKYEIEHGTNPLVMQDADGDGMSDQFEIAHGLNPADPSDALADPDGDGFLNVYEYKHGTGPFDSNSVPLPDRYVSLAGQHIAPFTNSATAASNIQAAVVAAAPYDIIQVADGTYTGAENRNLNFMGKPLMLLSENGPTNCILNGENGWRGLYIANSTGSVVRGIQFFQGYSDGSAGGAVYCENTRVLLENCWFRSNSSSDWGGAIYGLTASVILKNCVFEDNGVVGNFTGGAGYFEYNSNVEMMDCTVTGTLGDSGFYIYDSTFRVQGGTFSNNFCCSLEVSDSSGSINNCVFSDNQAPRYSGGVYFDSSDMVLSGCVFQNNSVASGYMRPGALSLWDGTLLVQNSVFSGNSSDEAAVSLSQGSIRLENCTLFSNQCPAICRYAGSIVVRNTILWGNESGSYNSAEGMDIEFSCLPEIAGTNNINMDPQLIAGAGALLPDSPCIDRGSDLTALATDMLGTPRWDHPLRSNGVDASISDIGAFEFSDSDADADGLGDLWEIYYFTNITFSSGSEYFDNDDLSTSDEYRQNTNPWLADTDGDGLSDGDEVNLHGTNPLNSDCDNDGLLDGAEIAAGTNPHLADSDNDGLPDGWELANGLNPLLSSDASADADGDGLTNLEEYVLGTDFQNSDTDGDGMPDGWEINNRFNPLWADSSVDADGDGLSNLEEYITGTDPRLTDTDGDSIPDKWELDHSLNPLFKDALIDFDSDGLINLLEYKYGTDPHNSDTDGDGLTDGAEINIYTSPLNDDMNNLDTDGDRMPDGWEVLHGLDPLVNDAALDSDSDGLTNLLEYQHGSDPQNPDTDGDGLTDGIEVSIYGTDPANADSDEDGLNDGVEVGIYSNVGVEVGIYCTSLNAGAEINTYGTDPLNGDSDGDGLSDGAEIECGTDPMNPDTDGDGIPDNRDVTSDGLVLITVTNQLPRYSAQVSAGTGNPEYKATVTFVPVLPSNTVRIVNALVDGWIDDSFKINGVQYGWTWGIKPFHENITGALPNLTNGIFDIELYDHVDPGWFGNGVSISGACVMDCLVGIKVESITPGSECHPLEIDDGDGNDKTKVFVVSVTNTSDVTVTATLNPTMAEADLPSGWTINGGQGSGKLQRTVSTASASKTEFTFNCGEADSGLKTTIYVYDAKLGLYADEGNAAQDKYGHSWWTFTVDTGIKEFIRDRYPDIDDNKYFGTAGWWPDTTDPDATFDPIKGWCLSARGIVQFGDQNHTATGSKTWDIGYDSLVASLNYVQDLETSGKNWTVLLDNCTDEAIIVGNEAGVSTISCFGITSPEDLSDWLNDN